MQPDTVIRVLMEYTPLEERVDIPEQELTPAPERLYQDGVSAAKTA